MSSAHDDPRRPYLREGLLLLGFLVLLVAAAFSVVLPELSREPDTASGARATSPATPAAHAPAK